MIAKLLRGFGKTFVFVVAGLALATAVACQTTVTTTPAPTPTSPAPATPPAAAPAAATEMKVTLSNGKVDLEKSTVPAGTVRFMVKNDGTFPHNLVILGQGIDQRTPNLQPGQSATLEVKLTAGEYEAYCAVPGHRENGMTTKLMIK